MTPPKTLLDQIPCDFKPVRRARAPLRQALLVTPLSLLILFAVFRLVGLRHDMATLGPYLSWGATVTQALFGILLIWVAARENTPAQRLPRNWVRASLVMAVVLLLTVTLWTFAVRPIHIPPAAALRAGLRCGSNEVLFGTVLIPIFAWMFRRSLAARPALTGLLYGAGIGITVNSGWRLACPVSEPSHSILSHGLGAVVVAVLGSIASVAVSKMARPKMGRDSRA